MFDGKIRFDVEQHANPDSIILRPGGKWIDGAVIAGDIATISKSPVAQSLMSGVHSGIKKSFTRVNAFGLEQKHLQRLTPEDV